MKLAILTGGSLGLGKELLALLEHDAWTVLEISRTGTSKHHITTDLADPTAFVDVVQAMRNMASEKPLQEILFINNAGIVTPIKRVGNATTAELLQSLAVNVTAPLVLISEFVALFREHAIPKTILNISSGAAVKGYAGWNLYCAGKAAAHNFFQAMYEEEKLVAHPYRVVNVNPYVMDTEMQAQIRSAEESEFPSRSRFIDFKENQQLLAPKTVAEAIHLLIRDHSLKGLAFDVKSVIP